MQQLFDEHLPADVCTFVTGDGEATGQSLATNDGVDKISFTGSVATGRAVGVEAARRIRPVTLELGGKSPMIVLADCDVDLAVDGIVQSMRFTRGGQSCTAASRVYVHRSMLDQVRATLAGRLNALVIGPPLDEATDCGPMVSRSNSETPCWSSWLRQRPMYSTCAGTVRSPMAPRLRRALRPPVCDLRASGNASGRTRGDLRAVVHLRLRRRQRCAASRQ